MLIYTPALDPYHCSIRIVAALSRRRLPVSRDVLRIADFYLVFPSEIASIRLPKDALRIRKTAEQLRSAYHPTGAPRTTFNRMNQPFEAAVFALEAKGVVSTRDGERNLLTLISEPEELLVAADAFFARLSPISSFVVDELMGWKFFGIDGLKHRTGLLEHRYDAT